MAGRRRPPTSTAEDADGTVVSYAWTAPAGAFDAPAQASATWTAPETPGDVEITVTVTDDDVDTAAATVTVTVQAPDGNQPPTVSATAEPPHRRTRVPTRFVQKYTARGSGGAGSVELDAEQPRDQPRRPPEGTWSLAPRESSESPTWSLHDQGSLPVRLARCGWRSSGAQGQGGFAVPLGDQRVVYGRGRDPTLRTLTRITLPSGKPAKP